MKTRGLLADAEPITAVTPTTYEQATSGTDSEKWKDGMPKEINSIVKNESWVLVPPPKDKSVRLAKENYQRANKTDTLSLTDRARFMTINLKKPYAESQSSYFVQNPF